MPDALDGGGHTNPADEIHGGEGVDLLEGRAHSVRATRAECLGGATLCVEPWRMRVEGQGANPARVELLLPVVYVHFTSILSAFIGPSQRFSRADCAVLRFAGPWPSFVARPESAEVLLVLFPVSMFHRLVLYLVGLSSLALTGCGWADDVERPGTLPESGGGVFYYGCTMLGDPACDVADPLMEHAGARVSSLSLPSRIAVGAHFGVVHSSSAVRSASDAILSRDDRGFLAMRPGRVGMYAFAWDGTMAAWVHIEIVEPAAIRLDGLSADTLTTGDRFSVQATLVDENGALLGGGRAFAWSTDDPSIAEVAAGDPSVPDSEGDDVAWVEAIGPGTTLLHVEAGEVRAVVELTVDAEVDE